MNAAAARLSHLEPEHVDLGLAVLLDRYRTDPFYELEEPGGGVFVVRQTEEPATANLWNSLDKVIYGPVHSRRLGRSLGINLLPGLKVCSFNCIYCDCGWTGYRDLSARDREANLFVNEQTLTAKIESGILKAAQSKTKIDYVTVCGNGEATLHPAFSSLTRTVVEAIRKHLPGTPSAILTNSSNLTDPLIAESLRHYDVCFYKLDAGDRRTFQRVCQPAAASEKAYGSDDFETIVKALRREGNRYPLLLSTAVVGAPDDKNSNLASLRGPFPEVVRQSGASGLFLHNIDFPSPTQSLWRLSLDQMTELGEYIATRSRCSVVVLEASKSQRDGRWCGVGA